MVVAGFTILPKNAARVLVTTFLATLAAIPATKAGSNDELPKAPCEERVKSITALAKFPYPAAWIVLGEMLETGDCLPENKTKAAEYFDRAAEEGYEPAYPLLGYMYANGLGVERDVDEARYWFKKYVLSNIWVDREKRSEWAISALDGRKVPPLLEEELQWLEDLLTAEPREKIKIALRLRDGDGLPLDRKAAYALLKKAMSKENPEAFYELGRGLLARDYVYGRSLRGQEVREALSYLSRAARVRYAPAEKALGLIYADPDGYDYRPFWGYVLLLRAKEGGAEGVDVTLAQLESFLSDKDRKYGKRVAKDQGRIYP